jgi:4-hydroxy-2-oxoheptanedioate aldolase
MTGIKQRLKNTNDLITTYVNLIPSAVVTQAIAAAGADSVVIDQEHAPTGPENLHAMITATAGTRCSPWVRVARGDAALVKLALDLGAEGIMFPLVSSAEAAAACVAMTRYPPQGKRGWGPFVAHSRWGTELFDYLPKRGNETVCSLLIETKAAVDRIEEICKVEGIDFLLIAPFDLSTDLGVSGQFNAPEFVAAVAHAERVILQAKIPLGGAAMTKEQTQAIIARGYRILAHGFDVLMLKNQVRQAAEWRK